MRLTFLGTRALTEKCSVRHSLNSALLVHERKTRLLVDCGSDWRGRIQVIAPQAIAITHAHADHAGGLEGVIPCPVFATQETWQNLQGYPFREKHIIPPETPIPIGDLTLEAIPLHHSERSPSVGFRLTTTRTRIFYSSDVALLPDPHRALRNVQLYIGDGTSHRTPFLRTGKNGPLGHSSIESQLKWCNDEKIPRAIFTHCGEELISDQAVEIEKEIQTLGEELGVETLIAWDGMEMILD